MSASIYRQKAEMFEQHSEQAKDSISRDHYREMAAHYRRLLVEHLELRSSEIA